MVECESCEIWFHADCVGLTNDTIPDKFICDRKPACCDFAAKQSASAGPKQKKRKTVKKKK